MARHTCWAKDVSRAPGVPPDKERRRLPSGCPEVVLAWCPNTRCMSASQSSDLQAAARSSGMRHPQVTCNLEAFPAAFRRVLRAATAGSAEACGQACCRQPGARPRPRIWPHAPGERWLLRLRGAQGRVRAGRVVRARQLLEELRGHVLERRWLVACRRRRHLLLLRLLLLSGGAGGGVGVGVRVVRSRGVGSCQRRRGGGRAAAAAAAAPQLGMAGVAERQPLRLADARHHVACTHKSVRTLRAVHHQATWDLQGKASRKELDAARAGGGAAPSAHLACSRPWSSACAPGRQWRAACPRPP